MRQSVGTRISRYDQVSFANQAYSCSLPFYSPVNYPTKNSLSILPYFRNASLYLHKIPHRSKAHPSSPVIGVLGRKPNLRLRCAENPELVCNASASFMLLPDSVLTMHPDCSQRGPPNSLPCQDDCGGRH